MTFGNYVILINDCPFRYNVQRYISKYLPTLFNMIFVLVAILCDSVTVFSSVVNCIVAHTDFDIETMLFGSMCLRVSVL